MLKKRIIFTLYFNEGNFYLSRNFRLQRVGDVKWLIDKFHFNKIGDFVDEIIFLNVGNEVKDSDIALKFKPTIDVLMKSIFVPLTIGGGIRTIEQANAYFKIGADKILLNTAILSDQDFVISCIERFGAQAIVAAVDYFDSEGGYFSRIENGTKKGLALIDHLEIIRKIGPGELMLNSIDRDGTGAGLDQKSTILFPRITNPIILAGGAGKPEHFGWAMKSANISAVATGNLFNFMGSGFQRVHSYLVSQGIPVRPRQ
jgi:cyclase